MKKIKEKKNIKKNNDKENSNDNTNNNINENGIKKTPSNYNTIFPSKSNMNLDAVITPENYIGFFSLNRNIKQSLIGNNDYLSKKIEKKFISGNSSFISVPIPPHVNL